MDRIKCRVDDQTQHDRDQRQRHQERDRRFTARELVERKLSTSRGNAKITGYDVCHPSTPSPAPAATCSGSELAALLTGSPPKMQWGSMVPRYIVGLFGEVILTPPEQMAEPLPG
jgi:hypothetical protein